MKIVLLTLLAAVVVSLFSGLFFLVKDKDALKSHLLRLADTPNLARVVPGHGSIIEDDPAGVLRAVAGTL